ncbi:MAG: hypothetical protein OEN21_11055 [Myxococcales bacterium]|nr:hypothetical protein [Myxococcales bacterium]
MSAARRVIEFRSCALAFAVVLSPVFLQVQCDRSGNPNLSSLEIEAAGLNRIVGFSPSVVTYDMWTTAGVDTIIVRATSAVPTARVNYRLVTGTIETGLVGFGGGEVTLTIPVGTPIQLALDISDGGAIRSYNVSINPTCSAGECDDANSCTGDACVASTCDFTTLPDGTSCNGGTGTCGAGVCGLLVPCTGTPGSGLPDDPDLCRKAITVAFSNNVTNDIFILPYTLEVLPTSPISASQPFTADLGGTAELTEEFLDFWQSVVPGGVDSIVVEDFKATAQTRGDGATGPDVPLALDVAALVPGPTQFCAFPPEQVCTMDSDCIVPPCNPPMTVVDFPTSVDCAPAGLCDSLGKAQQCTDNGFCVTSNLLLPLDPVLGAGFIAGDGVSPGQTEALFGWVDNPPPVTAVGVPPIDGDGTWNMIIPTYGAGVAGDLGIRLIVDNDVVTLFLPLEGVMGVDSDGPDGVGVPDDASPTPDSALLSFPVLCPFVCGDGTTDVCEECDDGNNVDGDGCDADCTLTPATCNFDQTGSDATPQTQTVNVGCAWNVTPSQFSFPWELSVSVPTVVTGGGMFTADFDGKAAFSEFSLDVLQAVIPGGAVTMEIVDLAATVQVRSGATGPDVVLGIDPAAVVPGLTSFCTFPVDQTCTVDGDCIVPPCLPPVLLVDVPNSTDCSPGGVCDTLGKNATQCLPNGFCVLSGDLFLPLVADSGTFTADAGGEVLFGWADQGVPDLTLCPAPAPNCTDLWMPDGSYDLPAAVFSNPTGPIGIRTDVGGGLFLAYQCAMGEPGGICSATVQGCLSDADCPAGEACIGLGTDNGVIIPMPDANLISCPIN